MSEGEHVIKLTDKELYVLWTIACWFERPLVTSKLKGKLAALASSEYREKHEDKVDEAVESRLVEIGGWLERRRKEPHAKS